MNTSRFVGGALSSVSSLAFFLACSSDPASEGATSLAADGGSSVDATASDGAAVDPGADAAGKTDAAASGDAGSSADLPPVTGFDEFAEGGNAPIVCDGSGTCFKSGSSISKLAPNGTSFTTIGSSANGLASFQLPGLALDAQGTLYTNICSQGVFKLPSGQTTWTGVGTGLSGNNGTSCNSNTLAVDAAGTVYVGFPISAELWKLPSGQAAWANTASGLTNGGVSSTLTLGLDVFVASGAGVRALLSGAAAWVTHGTGNPGNASRLVVDRAGNMYTNNAAGSDLADIYKLAAGTTVWARTSGLNRGDVNSPRVTNVAFDNQNNAYIVARPEVAPNTQGYALMKLPAGTLAWAKVMDLPAVSDDCLMLANDNIGHLVIQCTGKWFRTKP